MVGGGTATGGLAVADPSGQRAPVGDIRGWHEIFVDNFAGENVPLGHFPAAVSRRWGDYDDGWHDTTGHGTYMPSRVVSIANGVMDIYLHSAGGKHLVAAPYPILPGESPAGGRLYGRYVVRYRIEPAVGYKTAWLLWPDSGNWPGDGEIDFPEGDIARPAYMCGYVHHQGATSGSDQSAFCTRAATFDAWHTAVIQWTARAVTFTLDGRRIGRATRRIPDTSMHWLLQTETSLTAAPPPDSSSAHILIDWVAVYAPAKGRTRATRARAG